MRLCVMLLVHCGLQRSCEILLEVISHLPAGNRTDRPTVVPSDPVSGRHLLLTLCTEEEVTPYCVQLLLSCLKVKVN